LTNQVSHVVLWAVDTIHGFESLLVEKTFWVLLGSVTEHTGGEDISSIANKPSGKRSINEVWVRGDTLIEATSIVFKVNVDRVIGDFSVFLQVVEVQKVGHVHVVAVARSVVEIVTSAGSINLECVVGSVETTRLSDESAQVIQQILRVVGG